MSALAGLVRYLGLALLVACVAAVVLFVAVELPGGLQLSVPVAPSSDLTTSEFSLIENLQNLLLLFCAAIFAWVASRDRLRRPMAVGFSAMFLLFLIRELDYFLDVYVVDNLWQVLAAIVAAVAGVYVFRHRRRVELGWRRSWPSAGLGMLFGGLFLLLIFAQIVATDALWRAMLGDGYLREAKLAAEELMELGAYLVITVGSLEFLHGWSRLPKTRTMDRPRRRRRR